MNTSQLNIEKAILHIDDRLLGISNDLKTYLYVRKETLERSEKLGGGNIVYGMALSSCVNLLAKAYYCCKKGGERFNSEGEALNETNAFKSYSTFLKNNGVDLGIPDKDEERQDIWNGFRNFLSHRAVPQANKFIHLLPFSTKAEDSVDTILNNHKTSKAFEHKDNMWILHGDILLARLPEIQKITYEYLRTECEDSDLLCTVVDLRD